MSILHQLALTFIPGIGCVTARALVDALGSAEAVFKAKRSRLLAVPGIGWRTADAIIQKQCFVRATAELDFITKHRIVPLFYQDEAYPWRLRNCYDAPALLYYRGNADLNVRRVISIVGTRNATDYGKELTGLLVSGLQQHGALVVSGLALGIDGLAHRACTRHQVPTIGVMGHGLDRIYPSQHRSLAGKMLEHGGLLTEFPSNTNPDRENFPKRNRIIAGMADATIVVEAGARGGALITAEIANSYNRDVFAFPGDVFREFSAGCNYLIKTNRAHLVSGIKDIEYLLGWNERPKVPAQQISLMLNFSEDERTLTTILQNEGPTAIDELSIKTNIPQSRLVVAILNLEMQGVVVGMPGKVYRLT